MTSRVAEIFSESQRHSAVHKSNVKKLVAVLKEQNESDLQKCISLMFRGYVDQYLLIVKKEPAVERIVKFFCDFMAASSSSFDNDAIFLAGMEHLLNRSLVTDKNVRYRACQSLAYIITNIGDVPISDALLENMVQVLTPRLKDKDPKVRMWAVKTLALMQNGNDANDVLMLEFIRLMESDNAAAVRVCAVDTVIVSKYTLRALVARVRDIKPEVRIAALERLANSVDIKHLSTSQRATVATFGLNDRDNGCRNVAVGLVQKWATSVDNRIPKLLQMLGMTRYATAVELVGNALIDIVENSGNNPFPPSAGLKSAVREDTPKWDSDISQQHGGEILWAQLRCEYARKNFTPAAAEDTMSHLVPDIIVICKLLHSSHNTEEITSKESMKLSVLSLLKMTKFLDRADVSGGQELIKVCENMLIDIKFPDELVNHVLDAWLRGLGRADNQMIMDNIKLLSEKFANIDSNSTEGLDELDIEVLTATRGLQLVCWALGKGVNGSDNNQRLSSDFYGFAIDSLQSTSPDMRRLAVQCLGMMSLSSEELCASNRDILIQVAAQDLEELDVRDQALKAIVDVAAVHPKLFENDIMISNLLLRIMKDTESLFTSTLLRLNAAEASTKLLFSRTLNDSRLFSILLQLFFVPELLSNDDKIENSHENEEAVVRLQQLLSTFFNTFGLVHKATTTTAGTPDKFGIVILKKCITDLFSDMIVLCRDEYAHMSLLAKMTNYILTMSHDFNGGSSSSNASISTEALIAATICRESLKLGNSKNEKSIIKEIIKILATFTPETWGTNTASTSTLALCALKCAKCVNRNCTTDKTHTTALQGFMNSCVKATKITTNKGSTNASTTTNNVEEELLDDSEAYLRYEAEQKAIEETELFYTFAPGLCDLVEMIAVDDSDIECDHADESEEEVNENDLIFINNQEPTLKEVLGMEVYATAAPAPPSEGLVDLAENGEESVPAPAPKTSRTKKVTVTKSTTTKVASSKTSRAKKAPAVIEDEVSSRRSGRSTKNTRKIIEADEEEVDPENSNPQQV
jgi:hypothetical protein